MSYLILASKEMSAQLRISSRPLFPAIVLENLIRVIVENRYTVYSGYSALRDGVPCHGIHLNDLLEEAVKQLSTVGGCSAIEPEGELIEIATNAT
jgi:hypothetical protein